MDGATDKPHMPTTMPGISITAAGQLLQQTDQTIKTFPEVEHVFGKVGCADTATDPAPLSMIETTVLPNAWVYVDIDTATPLFAGVLTSGATVLIVFPILYYVWKSYRLPGGRFLRGFDPTDISAYAGT